MNSTLPFQGEKFMKEHMFRDVKTAEFLNWDDFSSSPETKRSRFIFQNGLQSLSQPSFRDPNLILDERNPYRVSNSTWKYKFPSRLTERNHELTLAAFLFVLHWVALQGGNLAFWQTKSSFTEIKQDDDCLFKQCFLSRPDSCWGYPHKLDISNLLAAPPLSLVLSPIRGYFWRNKYCAYSFGKNLYFWVEH